MLRGAPAAAARIDRYRKGDLTVIVRDDNGKPVPGAAVHVKMNRHAFGFGTAVAGDVLQSAGSDGQNYRSSLKKLFNKVVTENVLKWPPFESWGRAQADYMLPWFAANGFAMVRGHNVIWPSAQYLPADVQNMLKANPPDANALRARVNKHIADVMGYSKGKVTEWDVLNEAYTNRDLQAVLGDAEMTSWFRQARAADPAVKLYINDYSILESGGYDLQHINGYANIIRNMLAAGAPIDGIGLQSHFDSNLTPPSRVLELLDQFAAFGKDLQVTEFDVAVADEQVQADYTRDFLTVCFSHPAMKGLHDLGILGGRALETVGRHDPPQLVHQAQLRRLERPDLPPVVDRHARRHRRRRHVSYARLPRRLRRRGHHQRRDPDSTRSRSHRAPNQHSSTPARPAAAAIAPNGVVNAASFRGGAMAPGEIVTIYGAGFGPASLAWRSTRTANFPPASARLACCSTASPAPMIYASAGQVSAIVPYAVSGSTQVQIEYQGIATAPVAVPVAPRRREFSPAPTSLPRRSGHQRERRRGPLLQWRFRPSRPRFGRDLVSSPATVFPRRRLPMAVCPVRRTPLPLRRGL